MGLLLSTRRALMGTGAAWTPASPTTAGGVSPEHWYRSDSGLWQDAGTTPAAADGDVVGRWEDKTTNADHVNQANAGNKPTLQSGAGDLLNGHPVLRSDGIDDYLVGAFTNGGALAQPLTTFVVAKLDAAQAGDGNFRMLMDSDDNVNRMSHRQTNTNLWGLYGGAALSGGASDANWNTWTVLFNGVTSQFWHNGVSEAGPGDAGAHNPDGLVVFSRGALVDFWKGDITEILIYDANLSDADKNQVGAYLERRYSIAYTDI